MSVLRQRALSIVMFVAMVATMLTGLTITANAQNGTWSGSGTETDPYQIEDLQDLKAIANGVTSTNDYSGSYFKLVSDISVTALNWTKPIGTSESLDFAGVFDGNNHSISWSGSRTGMNYFGIFGYSTGIVKNLSTSGSLTVNGSYDYISPVVGFNAGTIDKVTNVTNLTASSAYNFGGIAGYNTGYILNSSNAGTIYGYRTMGGLVGENAGTINSCSNTGTVTSTYSGKNGVGGIAGRNGDKDTPTKTGNIWNCYNTATISDSNGKWVAGICGFQNTISNCVNCYNTGSVSAVDYYDHIAGNNEGTVSYCYGLGTTGYQLYDGADTSISDFNSLSFVQKLNKKAAGFWKRGTTTAELYKVAKTSSVNPASNTVTIVLQSAPFKTTYASGETFDTTGTEIRAVNMDGSYAVVTGFSVSNTSALTTSDTSVTISGTYAEQTYSFNVSITVTSPTTYYLDTGLANNGSGTLASPFNNLTSALNAAGTGDIIQVMDTVTINSATTLHNDVTFKRYNPTDNPFTGTMFEINPGTGNLVRLTTMRIDGGGVGTIFNVTSGTLNLRGGIMAYNAEKVVNVANGATLIVNKAYLQGSTYSIYVYAGGSFTYENYGGTTIVGTIYLANTSGSSNAFIDLDSVIFNTITVQMSYPQSNTIVAMASSASIAENSVDTNAPKISYAAGAKTIVQDSSNLVIQ